MADNFYKQDAYKSSSKDTWTTPVDFYQQLNKEFNFDLDAAAMASSALCDNWYGPDHPDDSRKDAFFRSWQNDSKGAIFLNPTIW